ncbi:hypothetical protein COLO4_22678 [Corchorus olitorius]|uniref:Uncharacterized protein n=1 Tax=Corchorus olitorius TaxID=93759 RepID=A0A1R3IKT1_9ROSI|nr:hypothetical protein COLO4_22678 [Corchorus olitorius]
MLMCKELEAIGKVLNAMGGPLQDTVNVGDTGVTLNCIPHLLGFVGAVSFHSHHPLPHPPQQPPRGPHSSLLPGCSTTLPFLCEAGCCVFGGI